MWVQVALLKLSELHQEELDLVIKPIVRDLVEDGQHLDLYRLDGVLDLSVLRLLLNDVLGQPHENVDPGALDHWWHTFLLLNAHVLGAHDGALADVAHVCYELGVDAILRDQREEGVQVYL